MKLVSLNVGLPHQVKFRGKLVTTAIFRMVALQHRVKLKRLNFEGDRQADLKVRRAVIKVKELSDGWRFHFIEQLDKFKK